MVEYSSTLVFSSKVKYLFSNAIECYAIVKIFEESKLELTGRCLDTVISGLILSRNFDEAVELLIRETSGDRTMIISVREHLKQLLVHNQVIYVMSVLEHVAINVHTFLII